MPRLIKDSRIVDDAWQLVRDPADALPDGPVIVPLARWLAERQRLLVRGDVGVCLNTDDEPEALAADVGNLPLIAVSFPAFHDGRGLSTGVLLRTRLGFKGDLRAVGDVQMDLLSYMRRCGFTSFVLRPDKDLEEALSGLRVMADYYQASVTDPVPPYRRQRHGN